MTLATSPTTTLPLPAGRYALDTGHYHVGFAIGHLGVSSVRGRFSDVTAELVVGDTLADVSVIADVGTASLDSGDDRRDQHVLSAELLDVGLRPQLSFRSTEITGSGSDWTLAGDLTIGAVTAPVSLGVTFGGTAPFYDGTTHVGFAARGEIDRHQFGIDLGQADALLGRTVTIELDLEFIAPS